MGKGAKGTPGGIGGAPPPVMGQGFNKPEQGILLSVFHIGRCQAGAVGQMGYEPLRPRQVAQHDSFQRWTVRLSRQGYQLLFTGAPAIGTVPIPCPCQGSPPPALAGSQSSW